MNRLAAEAVGTFVLVFAGTGAIVVNDTTGGAITHVGIALTFGLVVFALIVVLGPTSGAHFNPAVTLGLALAKRFDWRSVPSYLVAQLLGAFAASATLKGLFPLNATLGGTVPHGSPGQSFVLECLLSAGLMLAVLSVVRSNHAAAAAAIGAVIGLEAMFAGPISGASMNPVRSLAPAVVSGQLADLWIYLVAPPLGAAAAVLLDPVLRPVPEPPPCPA
jgi:aquaporin Z